jgi:hypothetical protein
VETSCGIVGLPALITRMDNYIYIYIDLNYKKKIGKIPFSYAPRREEKNTHGRAVPSGSDCSSWTEHPDEPKRFRVSVSRNKANTRYCDGLVMTRESLDYGSQNGLPSYKQ